MAMILVPALVTLAITVVRLFGELQHWSPLFFSRVAGGGFGLVGISWLIPILGIYFALKLRNEGSGPSSSGKALGFALLGLVAYALLNVASFKLLPIQGVLVVEFVWAAAAIALAFLGWPALARVLLGYAFAARIPVAVVMLFGILGSWGTHYDVLPPNAPPELVKLAPVMQWVWIGFVPQLTLWIVLTVVGGMLFGAIAVAVSGGSRAAA
jgi:hypothetical protein